MTPNFAITDVPYTGGAVVIASRQMTHAELKDHTSLAEESGSRQTPLLPVYRWDRWSRLLVMIQGPDVDAAREAFDAQVSVRADSPFWDGRQPAGTS